MGADDATEVAAAAAAVLSYAEVGQDTSEHKVSGALPPHPRLRHGCDQTIRQITLPPWPKASGRTISASGLALNSTGTQTLVPMLARAARGRCPYDLAIGPEAART